MTTIPGMTEIRGAGTSETWRKDAAKAAFNAAWDLIYRRDREPDHDAEMLVAACASRYLWEGVGGDEQRTVGDWQVAHVASLLGDAALALRFAARSLAIVEANGWSDWRLASALEGMARAFATAGDGEARDSYAARCREVLATMTDREDRVLIASQLATVPGIEAAPAEGTTE